MDFLSVAAPGNVATRLSAGRRTLSSGGTSWLGAALREETGAEEIVRFLSLPRSLRVAEITIERAAGYRPEV